MENTPRRGTTRPTSSTSPSKAASSTDGKQSDNGRIVARRNGTSCMLKTLFRMRNLSSTIYCLLDVFGHNRLCSLLRELRTEVVPFCSVLRLTHDDLYRC